MLEILIPVDCGGELFLIRIKEKKNGFLYTVPYTKIPGLDTKEEPKKWHGDLYLWFNDEVLPKTAPNRTPGDETDAWEEFCTSYERRTLSQLSGVEDLILATDKVVSYRHEILEITIRGKTCRLEGADVLNSRKFQVWHQFAFKSPVKFKGNDWENLMFAWMDMAEEGEVEEAAVRGVRTVDSILNYLRTQQPTTTKEDMEKAPMQPYFSPDGHVLLSTIVIQDIVKADGVSMRLAASMLKNYLAERSKPIRTGKGISRFWVFDPQKVGIQMQTRLITEEGEEGDEG